MRKNRDSSFKAHRNEKKLGNEAHKKMIFWKRKGKKIRNFFIIKTHFICNTLFGCQNFIS